MSNTAQKLKSLVLSHESLANTKKANDQRLTANDLVSISEAASRLGVSIDTVRRWEQKGIIQSVRTPGGTRKFYLSTLKEAKQNRRRYPKPLSIGEAAIILGSSVSSLRRWDSEGVLVPNSRNSSGERQYSTAQLNDYIKHQNGSITPSYKGEGESNQLSSRRSLEERSHSTSPEIAASSRLIGTPRNDESVISSASERSQASSPEISLPINRDRNDRKVVNSHPSADGLKANSLNSSFPPPTSHFNLPHRLSSVLLLLTFLVAIFTAGAVRDLLVKNASNNQLTTSKIVNLAKSVENQQQALFALQESDTPVASAEGKSLNSLNTLNSLRSLNSPEVLGEIFRDTTLEINTNLAVGGLLAAPQARFTAATNQLILGNNLTVSAEAQAAPVVATIPTLTADSTFLFTDQSQTVTNKIISGSANTITSLPNSALANPSITVNTSGTLSGGGVVALGGTITLTGTSSSPTGVTALTAGSGITVSGSTGDVTVTNSGVTALTGTANQVIASSSSGSVTLTLPQSIATTSTVQFGNIGVGTATPDASAVVDLTSTTKGFLSPRVTTAQRDAISSPATGLFIFNTTTNQFNVYTGSSWSTISGDSSWSGLTAPTANLALTMAGYTSTFTYNAATGASNLFNLTDTTSNTGTGYLLNLTTATGSTLKPFHVSAAGTEAIFVSATGNVGIGTTNPVYKLDVDGTLNATGAITAPTTTNTINSLIINSGALSAVTGYSQTTGNSSFSGGGNFSVDSAAFDVTTAGAISGVTGYTQSSGNFNLTSTSGAISAFGLSSASLSVTSGTLSLATVTSGDITATTGAATGLFNILTGNLKIGNDIPGVTLNGEDAYIEGTLEIDGAADFASTLTLGGAINGLTISSGALSGVTGFTETSGAFAFSGGGNFSVDSAAFDVTTGGAVSGVTTLVTSSTINSQTISSAANFTGTVDIASTTTLAGNLLANGNTTIGNAAADTLTVTGSLNSNVNFLDADSSSYTIAGADASTATGAAGDLTLRSGAGGGTSGNGGNLTLAGGTVTSGTAGYIALQTAGTERLRVTSTGTFLFEKGSNDLTLSITAPTGASRTATIPSLTGDDTFCFASLGNCAGSGSSVTTGGGSINKLSKFSAAQVINDSSITDTAASLAFDKEVNKTIQITNTTTADTAGATLAVLGAAGNGTGAGGPITITPGQGGATGTGGTITITSGAGGGTSGGSGNIILNTGTVTSGTIGYTAFQTGGTERFRIVSDGTFLFEKGSNDLTLSITAPTGASRTATVPAISTDDTFCLVNLGNCAGSGTGVTTPGGTAGYVPKFSGAQSIVNSIIYEDGTNVGIGTTTLSYKLHVQGTGGFTGAITAPTSTNTINSLIINSGALSGITGFTETSGAFAFSGGGNFSVDSAAFDVTTGGAVSGVTGYTQSSGNFNLTSSSGAISATGLSAGTLSVTSGTLALATVTSGDITATTGAATGLFNVLTGNLKVGNGTPGVTLNGEDAYIEGTLEVDGASQMDGTLTLNSLSSNSGTALCVNSGLVGTCSGGSNLTGSGTSGQIAFFNGANSITSESSGFGWDTATKVLTVSSTATTQTANSFTAATLTTGKLSSFTATQNSAADSAWSSNLFTINNTQGTTAVSTGSIAGLDIQFNQNTSIAGNTETAARVAVKQNDSSTTDQTVSSLLSLENNDTATGNQITVSRGVSITGTNITDGIYLNGTFGTNLINSSTGNLVVTQAGALTVASTITANTTGSINGLSVSSGALSAVTGYAQTSGTFAFSGANNFSIDSSAFDVTTGGAVSGITGYTQSSGNFNLTSSSGAISATGLSSASVSVTSGTLSLATVTSGDITATTGAATGLFNILTGNLKIGNGTPGVTLNGEDAYIEGTFEVDGTSRFDSALTGTTATFASTGSLTLGTASSATGQILLKNSGNSNSLTLASGATAADYTLTLPTSGGTSAYVLTTDGSGTTSWTDPGTLAVKWNSIANPGGNQSLSMGTNLTSWTFTNTAAAANSNSFTAANSSFAAGVGYTGNLFNLTFTNGSTNTSGTSVTTGLNIAATNTASGTSGIMETYGIRLQDIAGAAANGTQNNFGLRIGNYGLSGAETSYGLYVDSQSGSATANYAAIFAGGNVAVGLTAPAAQLDILAVAASTGFNLAGTAPASVAGNGTNAATNTLLVVGTAGGASSGITGQTGGTGGALSLTSGVGGAVAGASGIGGVGGGLTLAGGAGGNGAATGGTGGAISITAGNAGTGGNANGGTLTLNSGAVTGSGTSTLNLGSANATTVNLATSTSATTLNIGAASTTAVTVAIAGGSGDTGCTVAGATGNLTCTGTLTGTGGAAAVLGSGAANQVTYWSSATNVTGSTSYTFAPAATTGNSLALTDSTITTGNVFSLSSTSTAGGASGSSYLLNLARSGANAQLAHTAYGIYSIVTNTNVTSGTNIAGYFSASGATTANYGLIVEAGNVGIGTTNPGAKLTVYNGDVTIDKQNSGAGGELNLRRSDGNVGVGDFLGGIDFEGVVSSSTVTFSRISSAAETANTQDSRLQFFTSLSGSMTERMRIDKNGTVLIGHTASVGRLGQPLEVIASGNYGGQSLTTYSSTAAQAPALDFQRSKSATKGTQTVVASGDALGYITFRGSDGTNFLDAASIQATVDGTPGTNDMPTRLTFATTADGASSGTERMRIDNAGNVGIGTTSPSTIYGAGGSSFGTKTMIYGAAGTSVAAPLLQLTDSTAYISGADRNAGIFFGGLDSASAVQATASILGVSNFTASSAGTGYLAFRTKSSTDNIDGAAERMRITSVGNVGIGTTNPGNLLHVYKNTGSSAELIKFENAGIGENYVRLAVASGASYGQWITQGKTVTWGMGYHGDSNFSIVDWTSPTVRLTINTSGNVLLPASQYLNWGTTGGTSGYGFRDNAGTMEFKNSAGAWAAVTSGSATGGWTDSGSTVHLTTGTDNVGIGTTTANYKVDIRLDDAGTTTIPDVLSISHTTTGIAAAGLGTSLLFTAEDDGGTTDLTIGRITARWISAAAATRTSALDFKTRNGGSITTAMTIDNAGNVGIGTTAPVDVLDVRGSIISQAFGTFNDIYLRRANGTVGAPTIVSNADPVGDIQFWGYDGGSYLRTAQIRSAVDATPASTKMPGNLNFYTSSNATPSVLTERMRIDSAGSVGIGTTSPLKKLDIYDSNRTIAADDYNLLIRTSDAQAIDKGGSLAFGGWNDDGAATVQAFGAIAGRKENGTTTNTAGYLQFATRPAGGSMTERLRITSAGSVGIGTTSPNITNYGSTSTVTTIQGTSGSGGVLELASSQASANEVSVGDLSWNLTTATAGHTQLAAIQGRTRPTGGTAGKLGGQIAFYTKLDNGAVTRKMTLDDDGNLGIGTTGPGTPLHIYSTSSPQMLIEYASATDSWAGIKLKRGSDSTDQAWQIVSGAGGNTDNFAIEDIDASGTGANSPFMIEAGRNGNTLWLDNTGNVGIGTAVPAYKTQIRGTTGYSTSDDTGTIMAIQSTTSRYPTFPGETTGIAFLKNGEILGSRILSQYYTDDYAGMSLSFQISSAPSTWSTKMLIEGVGGNVGIGTVSPDSIKLDVEGDVEVGTGTTGCVRDADNTTLTGSCVSDQRLKTNITSMSGTLDKLAQLRPITFDWINQEQYGYGRETGFIAQEAAQVFPEMVQIGPDGYFRVSYDAALQVKTIQGLIELNTKVNDYQTQSSVRLDSEGNVIMSQLKVGKLILDPNLDLSGTANEEGTLSYRIMSLEDRVRDLESCHSRESGNPWIPDQAGDDNSGAGDDNCVGPSFASTMTTIQVALQSQGDSIAFTLSKVEGLQNDINNQTVMLETATQSIASNSAGLTEVAFKTDNLEASISQTSSTLSNLQKLIDSFISNPSTSSGNNGEATSSGNIDYSLSESSSRSATDLNLTPVDGLLALSAAEGIATDSATLANLNVTDKITTLKLNASEATISGRFIAMGDNFLGGNTYQGGDFIQAGTFSITGGNTINVIGSCHSREGGNQAPGSPVGAGDDNCGTLYLQNSPLAKAVDFFNGLITLTKDGLIKANTVVAAEIQVIPDRTTGNSKIATGAKTVQITNPLVKQSSRILITPTTSTDKVLAVIAKVEETTPGLGHFVVSAPIITTSDIYFDWWILNEEASAN